MRNSFDTENNEQPLGGQESQPLLSIQQVDSGGLASQNTQGLSEVVNAIFKSSLKQPKLGPVANALAQSSASAVSVIGSLNYLEMTKMIIKNGDKFLLLHHVEYAEVCTVLFSALILLNSMQLLKGWLREENISQDIEGYFPRRSRFNYYLSNLFILVGSALSSIPLSIIYLNYSDDPVVTEAVMESLIEIANTLMHFLPFFVTLYRPPYNWPVLLGNALVSGVKSLFVKNEVAEDLRMDHIGFLLQKLAARINKAAEQEFAASLTYQGLLHWDVYDLELTTNLERAIQETKLTPIMQEKDLQLPPPSSAAANAVQVAVRVSGVGVMEMGCLGYTANVFNTLIREFGTKAGIAAAAVPGYAYAVLVAFFAEMTSLKTMGTVMTLAQGKLPLTLDDKLFPRYSLLMFLTAAAFGLAAYSGNLQVNKDNFENEILLDVMAVCGIVGFVLVGFLCTSQFHEWTSKEWVRYAGTQDQKNMNDVREACAMTTARLFKMSPSAAIEMIEKSSKDELQQWLGESKASLSQSGFFSNSEEGDDTDDSVDSTNSNSI